MCVCVCVCVCVCGGRWVGVRTLVTGFCAGPWSAPALNSSRAYEREEKREWGREREPGREGGREEKSHLCFGVFASAAFSLLCRAASLQ